MIHFRCWRCHRKYSKPDKKIGATFPCSCDSIVRVPKRDGGNCRVKTIADRLVEAVVCGGGCAFLGFCFAMLILSRVRFFASEVTFYFIGGLTAGCGLVGLLFGERSIDWIGDIIRSKERD